MLDLGTVRPGSTIRIPFSSFDKDDGSSITMTNFAAADILVYKDGSTTERASTAGYTATTDFDAKTGKHLIVIDLADDTTADFWKAGSEYLVAVDAVTVDTVTVGAWVARFRIGYPGALIDTFIATLSSQTSFTLTTGPAEDDALNGFWGIAHDKASAVQCAGIEIADYTGSTKTVTLSAAPTFTIAAGDNVSVLGPPANNGDAVYGARIWMIDDNAAGTPTDRYVVAYMKNGQPITTGITSPQIQVIKASDGTDLIAATTLTQIGATGLYRYDATSTARVVDGAAYLVKITATIDAATRTMYQPVGRDS